MAFTTPRTWVKAQIVTADELNVDIRDNIDYLKDRLDGTAKQFIRTATDYTTTSTSIVDIDATNLSLTFTTDGSDVICTFTGVAAANTSEDVSIIVDIDATDHIIIVLRGTGAARYMDASFIFIFTGLSAASHTFKMQWKVTGGTTTLLAGRILFDVREMIGLVA